MENEAFKVINIPGVPTSAAYCQSCFECEVFPLDILLSHTAWVGNGSVKEMNEEWKRMVMRTLKHFNKSFEWFEEEVQKTFVVFGETLPLK